MQRWYSHFGSWTASGLGTFHPPLPAGLLTRELGAEDKITPIIEALASTAESGMGEASVNCESRVFHLFRDLRAMSADVATYIRYHRTEWADCGVGLPRATLLHTFDQDTEAAKKG